MWIALNEGFISIVEPRQLDVPKAERRKGWQSNLLMVRARKAVHLKRHFPKHKVYEFRGRDYPCRVFVKRGEVADVIGRLIAGIAYTNFKNSVHDDELHDAYMGVWTVMHRYQHGAYRRRPWSPTGIQQQFSWEPGEETEKLLDGEACGLLGCTPENPCMDCLTKALAHENERFRGREPDRYGDFNDEDDIDAQSHLRAPSK